MSEERLRLVAEVQDGFTGPLGKLNTALQRTATTGMQAGKDLKKDFEGFHGVLGKTNSALQGMLAPLSGLGVAGLGAGLGLGAITAALGGFSKGTAQLALMSRETGLAVDQLRAFGALGERFGVSAETMQGGVKRFSEEMSQLRKRYGEAYSSLQAMNLGELVEKLVNAPNMKAALDSAMEALSNIGDPVRRRKVAEQLFGADQIGAVAGQVTGKYRDMMDDIERRQGQTTDAQVKAAQRFEQTLSQLRENMDGLRVNALGPLLVEFNKFIATLNTPDAIKFISGEIEGFKKLIADTVSEFQKLDKLGESLKGGKFDLKGNSERELETIAKLFGAIKNALGLGGYPTVQQQSFGGGGFGGGGVGGGPLIQRASFGGGGFGGGYGGPGLGGFGGPLPTMGGGYGGGNPNVSGGGAGRGYGGPAISPSAPLPSLGRGAAAVEGPLARKYPDGLAAGIKQSAKDLGISAEDLATVISYETAGTFNPWKRGPTTKWGTHRGLIQWGEPQARKYGVTPDMTPGEQMRAVTRYLRDRGVRPGMGIHQVYGAINAGGVSEAHLQMRDAASGGAPGTVLEKVDNQMGAHRRKGIALLGAETSVAEDASGSASRSGDQMMRRFYGEEAPVAKSSKGSLDITLHGFPAGTKPRASMDDLFKNVNVSKSRQMETTSL